MSSQRWRNLCFLLGAACIVLVWRDCHAVHAPAATAECPPPRAAAASDSPTARHTTEPSADPATAPQAPQVAAEPEGIGLYGFTIPNWAVWLAPHLGEDLRAYRKRMLPIYQAAIAPHRARVARSRDDFAALAHLDSHQRAALDGATSDTAAAIQDRVMNAVLSGELSPDTFKPMAAVGVARDVLDLVGRGNQRFLASLRDDQRATLAQHPFDFGDYLAFATRWEDALKFLD